MHDAGAMLRGEACDGAAQRRLEPLAAAKGGHTDVLAPQHLAPAASLIEATHGHRQLRTKPSHELDHEPLGSAWIEAQNHLQHLGWCLASRWAHGYRILPALGGARLRPEDGRARMTSSRS
jgi:hypothetical protein